MYISTQSYALWGEAAFAGYEAGEIAEYDGNSAASHVCRKFAEAIANSLRAMLAFNAAPFDPASCNLARYLGELKRSGIDLPDGLASNVRLAMRALVLTTTEVHNDLLTTDLFHEEDIADAKAAANAVCDWMCECLVGMSLETVQLKFYKVHDSPATSADFWNRRRLARVRSARRERPAATAEVVTADGEV